MKNQKRIQTRKNLIINKFNLFILLLGISPAFIQAQTYTWTGNQGTAWSNSSNWTGASGTPTAGSSVIIPNTSNDPIIFDDDNFTISELRVQSGGKLTLQNGAILNVTKSNSGATTTCITNDGTIVNRGVLNLTENGATTQPAIQNNGVFQNNAETNIDSGELNISDVSGNGIFNAGTFTNFSNSDISITNVAGVYGINTSSTFTNNGEIIISGGDDLGLRVSGGSSTFINNDLLDITACTNGVNVTIGATLNNSGDIYLDDIVNVAIMVNNDNPTDPTFNNNATGIININQRNTVNCNNGIIVFDGFFYNTGGQINIDYTSNPTSILDKAIQLSDGSIFVNEDGGIVNLAPLGSDLGQTAITVFEGGTLLNSACSGIINNSLQSRLSTLSGAFNNNGWIVSYSNAPSNISTNFGTVVNYGNAPVNINDALANPAIKLPTNYTHVWTGAEDADWTNLCNWASDVLPTTTSEVWIERETFNPVIASDVQIQALGISSENSSRLNVNTGVTLTLDGASDVGLLVEGEVVNNGTIRIDNTSGAGMQISNSFSLSGKTYISETGGVSGAGIITDADASLTISNCAKVHVYENVNLNEPINNQGYLLVNSAETNTGTITNNGVLNFPLGSSNLSITNNDLIINHFDLNGCTVSNILSIGSSNNFTAGSTWYSNAAQTNVLGTYNSVDNTFTISTTPSQGTQNAYFNVSGNGCTYNVQIPYTIEIPNNNRITWTGAVDNNWNEACNWTPAIVPTADEEAWIPSQTNSPIIKDGVMANAKYVRIQSSATLTIASGGQLNITDSDGDGVRNQGTLNCQLNSVLNITDPFGRGLYNDEGIINNQGTITITDPEGRASMQAGGYGLLNEDGTINNNANGTINISMGIPQNDDSGMEIRSGNVFNNANATIMTDAPSGFDINIAGGTLTNEGLIDADGDINVTSSGTLTTIVNSTSSYGEITLNTTGTASLDGTINATVNYTPGDGDRIPFIASASSISGTFATENLPTNWETDYSVNTEVALVLNPTLITWTGTVDNDWTNPSNWSPTVVPTADEDVIIPSQTNDPIIQDNVVANTKSVHIEPSAQLTIQNGGRINVTNSDGNGIYNQGTIESQFNGLFFISNTTGVAIYNEGTITTRGNINISEPDGHGLVNDGGTINNNANGIFNISMNNAPADKNAVELLSGNIFNNANAFIFPNAPNGFDVNIAGGTLTNEGFVQTVGDINIAAAGTLTTIVNSSSSFGQITLNNNGTAYLDGTINATINYTPNDGDRIAFIASASSTSGTFATENLPSFWVTDYSVSTEVALVYVGVYTPGLWDGDAGDGEWNTAANWDGNVLPSADDKVVIDNGDAVTLSSGSVEVESIDLASTSSLSISSGATLTASHKFNYASSSTTGIWIRAGSTLTNSGDINLTGPNVTRGIYCQGTLTNNTDANITFSDAGFRTALYVGQTTSIAPVVTNSGTLTLNEPDLLGVDMQSGMFTNAAGGVIDIEGTFGTFGISYWYGSFTNEAGATIDINGGSRGLDNRWNFDNAGTLIINNASSRSIYSITDFNNTGTLQGTGTFRFEGYDLGGNIVPGNSPGVMDFEGDQTFTAASKLEIEINGTASAQRDQINVDGTATISGTLVPSINYTPTDGDRIVFLTGTSISGTFATINPALPAGWSVDYSVADEVALVYEDYIPGLWDGDAGDGEWTTAANWDGDVLPTADDDVVIDNGDAVTLSSGSVEVATINLSGNSSLSISSGATLTVSGKFNYSNSNTASIWIDSGSTITNSGDINLTATNVTRGLNCGGTLTNNAGANITFSDSDFDYQLYTNQTSAIEPIVMNSGTITLNEPDFSGIEIQGGILTNNSSGLIEVDGTSGYIGIFLGTGTITNASGGIIDLSGGWRGLDNRDEFNNAGTLIINNPSSFSAYSVSDFNNTGNIKGTGKWYFEGYDLDGNLLPGNDIGAMNFDDSQVFTASSTFEIEVNGTTNALRDRINVNGTATISGTLAPSINYTPTFGDRIVFLTATAISGTFATIDPALPSNWSVDYSVAGEVALVYDYTPGLWDGDAGDGEWTTAANWDGDVLPTADDDVVINNGDAVTLSSGSVEVGTINLSGNSSLSISSGATLTVSNKFNYSSSYTASIWINSGSTITNSGDINLTGTNVTRGLNCEGTLTNNAGGNITFSDSDIDRQLYVRQTTAIQPVVVNNGTITFIEPDIYGIETSGGIFTNATGGIIDINGTSNFDGIAVWSGTFTNATGGTIVIDDGSRGLDNRGVFNNAGMLTIINTSQHAIYSVSDFNNTGSIKGTGKWYFEGYDLDGNILPGNDIGTMNFDDSQVFTASSTFEIQVNGTTNALRDRINVNGTATISGTLAPSINYSPTDGDRIVFLKATTISGTFATISPALSLGWSVDYSVAGEVALVYCAPITYYLDSDDDGYGDPAVSIIDCSAPMGYVTDNTDCDDNDGDEFPGQTWYEDADNDGYSTGTAQTACERPTGYRPASELFNTTDIDCNDNNADINPDATEICNGIDDNCDTQIDEGVQTTYYADTDGDGFGDPAVSVMDCSAPTGYVTDNTDCDDTDGNEFPGQTWYIDADGDDYGSYSTTACERPNDGFLLEELMGDGTDDCVDNNAAINPSAKEICDGIDNDCDGLFDSNDPNYVDNTMPTLSCPSNINTSLDAGQCGATISWTAPTATDNCIGSFTATQTMGEASGTLFPAGTHTIQYTATDDAGNAATCSFTITVTDTDAPSASCQDVSVQLDTDGNGSLIVAQVDNGSSDVCGIKTMTLDQSTFDCSQVGQQSVTLTVVDNSDNTSSCTANVTIVDGIAPNAQCKDISRNLNANGTKNINANAIDKNSSDACGIASMSLSQTQFFCEDVGPNTVTLTVTDINGNSSTCTATVTINDDTAPMAVCQDVTVQLDADGNGSLNASQVDNGSSDACGITSSFIDMPSFGCDEIGSQIVTLTVTDEAGNTSNCTATVTVEDNIAPVAVCQDKTVVFNGENQANVAISELFDASNSYDNCGTAQVIAPSNDEVISCGQIGSTISVTISVSDDYGNTADCISNITVRGLPCGWVDDGGIGCQSDPSVYDASNESYELSTSDCSPAYPYVNDEMAFTYTELCGDGELTVFVSGVLGDGFAGIMMRESTDPDARKVAIATNGINQILKEVRINPAYPAWPQAITAYDQLWLRISRTGFSFKAYASVDGVNWLPYIFQNVQMSDCIQVGMYTYTKVVNNNVTATFEEVTLTGGNSNLAGQPNIITFGEAANDIPTPTVDVYPNPAIDFLNIVTEGASTKGSIQIVNTSGQSMYQAELLINETQQLIDVSNWPKGMYILRVEQDGQVINKQVIIQ